MMRGNLGWLEKSSRELSILTEWLPDEVYWSTRRSGESNRAALYAIDLVSRLLQDRDPHPEVYEALDTVLTSLAQPPDPAPHLLRFQWSLLDAMGWRPVVERDVLTGEEISEDCAVLGFRSAEGGVVEHAGEQDWRVRRETVDMLVKLGSGEISEEIPTDVASRASGLLAVYTRDLIGEATEAMRHAFPSLG